MDGRVERPAIQNTQGHFTYLLLIMLQQLITQVNTAPLSVALDDSSADWSRLSLVVELLACGRAQSYITCYMLEAFENKILYMDLHYWLTIQGG